MQTKYDSNIPHCLQLFVSTSFAQRSESPFNLANFGSDRTFVT